MPDQYIVGVNIGSSKLCSTIAVRERNGAIRYVGHGSAPSAGVRSGEVIAPDALGAALKRAVEEAHYLMGRAVDDIIVSVSGTRIEFLDRTGGLDLDRQRPITQADAARVLESSRGVDPPDLATVHRVVRAFAVDGEPVDDPLGRRGSRLDVVTRDFAVPSQLVDRLRRAADLAGVHIHSLIPEGVAAAAAVLTPQERQAGVAVVDIGAASTDLAVYINDTLRHLAGIPLGGNHVTADIAGVLDIASEEAERLKRRHGALDERSNDELIEWTPRAVAAIQRMASQGEAPPSAVRSIAAARSIQIIDRVHDILRQANLLPGLRAGVVLTGGGSQLRGIDSIARAILGVPVRTGGVLAGDGFPGIDDPAVAASTGLARYAAVRADAPTSRSPSRAASANAIVHPMIRKMIARQDTIDVIPGDSRQRTRRSSPGWGQKIGNWMREFIPERIEDSEL